MVNYTQQNYGTATESWLLNTTRVLVVQRQIFMNKTHVLQVE